MSFQQEGEKGSQLTETEETSVETKEETSRLENSGDQEELLEHK